MVKARVSYTAEQLLHLRDSPLITKPDSLPSIDQWVEQSQDTAQRKPREQNGRSEDVPTMGNFAQPRPSLLQTRSTRASNGDDVVLGPPKMAFTSSRNIRRTDEDGSGSGNQALQEDDFVLEAISARTRGAAGEDGARRRATGLDTDKDGWVSARNGRGNDGRGAMNDKEKQIGRNARDRTTSQADDGARRTGFGTRAGGRWSRESEDKRGGKPGMREGGWRDREKRQESDPHRNQPQEKEPEWMDEPVEDASQQRTVADFEKWKAKMRGQKYEEPNEREVEVTLPEKSPAFAVASAPLLSDAMFGTWGDVKKPDADSLQEAMTPKPAGNKKASRFASMFAPKEEPRHTLPEPQAPQQPSLPAAATEDEQGFQNILMKLRGVSLPATQEPLARSGSGPPPGFSPGRQNTHAEKDSSQHPLIQAIFSANNPDGRPDGHPAAQIPDSPAHHRLVHQQATEPSHQHHGQESHGSMPPRTATPEAQALQNLLAAQRSQKSGALNKDSEFLLNLIQAKRTPQPTPPSQHDPNFQLFLDKPPRPQTQAHPPRQPPPGLMQGNREPFFSPSAHPDGLPDRRQAPTAPPPGFFDNHNPLQIPPHQRRPPNGPPGFGPPPDFFSPNPDELRHHPDRDGLGGPPPGVPPQLRPGPVNMHNIFPLGGPPPSGPNVPPPPQFLQQHRGPPGLGPLPPPPGVDHFSGGQGASIGPPPGFQAGMPSQYTSGAPPGFGGPPPSLASMGQQRGQPMVGGLNNTMQGLGGGFSDRRTARAPARVGEGAGAIGIMSPVEGGGGFGGFGRGR